MSQPTTSAVDRLSWDDILTSAGKIGSVQLYLHRLLQFFCQEKGLGGAALYIWADDGLERQVTCGTGGFPVSVEDVDSLPEPNFELPGGFLTYLQSDSDPQDLEGPWALALSSALQATVLQQRLKQESFVVNYRGVELEALYDVGLAIASMLNLEDLGEEALLRAVSLLDARRGALYLRQGDRYLLDHALGGEAKQDLALGDSKIQMLIEGRLDGPQNILPDASYLMAVPIGADARPQGLLVVADKESRQGVGRFKDADRRTLSLFANQVAIALETAYLHKQALEKERLERELDLAADIQRRLLPEVLPKLDGYELAGWSRPARHVGGDYYDFMSVRDQKVTAVLADVSGKGMPAALMVSTIHSALRLLVNQTEVGSGLITHLNQHIAESSAPNRFITLFLAELDPESNRVKYVNAGHNPALMIRASGSVEELGSGGLPIGLFKDGSFEQGCVEMGRGDLFCAYSDGLTECLSRSDEEFGLGRLTELVASLQGRPLTDIVTTVDDAVTEFAQGQSQGDDQTIVLVRRRA
jgi:sigma-B regulation protein RsbU (phosphoserine phosphatase)